MVHNSIHHHVPLSNHFFQVWNPFQKQKLFLDFVPKNRLTSMVSQGKFQYSEELSCFPWETTNELFCFSSFHVYLHRHILAILPYALLNPNNPSPFQYADIHLRYYQFSECTTFQTQLAFLVVLDLKYITFSLLVIRILNTFITTERIWLFHM